MKDMMQKVIELLKERVRLNLETVKANQSEIKNILASKSDTNMKMEYRKKYNINKSLLMENNDFINLQLQLVNFLNKYRDADFLDNNEASVTAREISKKENLDYFELTISGLIPFDKEHPLYEDDDFFERLLDYYQEMENYEMCEALVKSR